jgi:hypothetical protein
VSAVDVSYSEETESVRIESVRLAHLSIEAGHLYLEDFADGDKALREQLERTAPYVDFYQRRLRKRLGRHARISTCFMVDDYTPSRSSRPTPPPSEVAEMLTTTARDQGFAIDYLAREAGCVSAAERPYAGVREQSRLAEIVTGQIVEEAAENANGSRPPAVKVGWLSNGRRSPTVTVAMDSPGWQPPEEYGNRRHSVFVDVELWHKDDSGGRIYSCSMLSTVWQLLRLGLLRDSGKAVAQAYRFTEEEDFPDSWAKLPTVIKLTPDAAPFAAYQAVSVLPPEYHAVETAVEIIIEHLRFDQRVLEETAERARNEPQPLHLPNSPARRLSYVYLDDVHVLLDSGV